MLIDIKKDIRLHTYIYNIFVISNYRIYKYIYTSKLLHSNKRILDRLYDRIDRICDEAKQK